MYLTFTTFTYLYVNQLKHVEKQNLIAKNRFKKIMDISEEGIVIIKEQSIEYVNDMFINQQKNSIFNVCIEQNE
jgi:hypothetical protein